MENSHHAAKAAYQRHTQHSRGKNRKSALLQTYEHWYRIIQYRFRNLEFQTNDSEPTDDTPDMEVAIQARRERYLASSASAHWIAWKATRTRQGSRWVPNSQQVEADVEPVNVESMSNQLHIGDQLQTGIEPVNIEPANIADH